MALHEPGQARTSPDKLSCKSKGKAATLKGWRYTGETGRQPRQEQSHRQRCHPPDLVGINTGVALHGQKRTGGNGKGARSLALFSTVGPTSDLPGPSGGMHL